MTTQPPSLERRQWGDEGYLETFTLYPDGQRAPDKAVVIVFVFLFLFFFTRLPMYYRTQEQADEREAQGPVRGKGTGFHALFRPVISPTSPCARQPRSSWKPVLLAFYGGPTAMVLPL